MDKQGNFACCGRCILPEGYVKGTVGAGDAFCAGVLSGAYRGLSLEESIRLGNCSASASLASPGATDSVVTIEKALELGAGFGFADLPEMK